MLKGKPKNTLCVYKQASHVQSHLREEIFLCSSLASMRVRTYVHVSAASRPPRRAGRRLASAQNERFIYSLASAIAIEFKVTCISNPPLKLDNAILAGSFTENEELF